MSELMQRKLASLMLAIKYFGSLSHPAGQYEQRVLDAAMELGLIVEENGRYTIRKK